jgi:hypothetical protein
VGSGVLLTEKEKKQWNRWSVRDGTVDMEPVLET